MQLHPLGRPLDHIEVRPRDLSLSHALSPSEADLNLVVPVWTAKGEFLPEIHGGKFSREALRGREVLRSGPLADEFARELNRQVRARAPGRPGRDNRALARFHHERFQAASPTQSCDGEAAGVAALGWKHDPEFKFSSYRKDHGFASL